MKDVTCLENLDNSQYADVWFSVEHVGLQAKIELDAQDAILEINWQEDVIYEVSKR